MKMVLSHIFLEYEMKLADPECNPHMNLGKVRLPSPFTMLLVRKKERVDENMNRMS
jgi:hypothetical protein